MSYVNLQRETKEKGPYSLIRLYVFTQMRIYLRQMTADPKRPKTVSIHGDVIAAVEIYLAQFKRRSGPANFSEAAEQGLRLFLSHNKTSVPKMLAHTARNNHSRKNK
jgi:hypothetical protein